MIQIRKISFIIGLILIGVSCGDKKVLEPKNSLSPTAPITPKKVGDLYGGGTIIYVDASGQHGYIAAPHDFPSKGSIPIPDNSQIISNIVVLGVPEGFGFLLSSVCVNINHPYDADLDISLRAPNGNTIDLSSDNGGGGDNYTNTCFSSGPSITIGNPPFSGNFSPEQSLSGLYNSSFTHNGTWSLIVKDDSSSDSGTLLNWSITFSVYGTFNYPNPDIPWNTGTSYYIGASSSALGAGKNNTSQIISLHGNGYYAAKICDAYTNEGFADWYLPSSNEIYHLWLNRFSLSNYYALSTYWTSTEASTSSAFAIDFLSGSINTYPKSNNYIVRPIRAF